MILFLLPIFHFPESQEKERKRTFLTQTIRGGNFYRGETTPTQEAQPFYMQQIKTSKKKYWRMSFQLAYEELLYELCRAKRIRLRNRPAREKGQGKKNKGRYGVGVSHEDVITQTFQSGCFKQNI